MKVIVFFTLCYFSTAVWAGGYQGCLERVLLFQAYQIDELNDEKDRTIGYKCTRWNEPKKVCDGTYQACRLRRKGADRCNYDELIVHLGKTHVQKGWSVLDADGNLDVDKTALNTYKLYEARPRSSTAPLIPNFPAFVAMKGDVYIWNEYVTRLGQIVNDTFKTKKTKENEHLWTAFDSISEKIRVARAGDHGPHLYKAAQERLGGGITVHKQNLGKDPATGETWETVDWKETAV